MGLLSKLLGQCGHPRGWLGRELARSMNRGHAPLTDWLFEQIARHGVRSVLDIGCGGGAAARKLAKLFPHASVHGIDHSSASLEVAARMNRRLMESGRVSIMRASVSDLPFDDDTFDLAIAIESHYFWPDLENDLSEVRRVLRPGGTLALGGHEYFGGRFDRRNRRLAAEGRMNCQTLPELRAIIESAGYTDVSTLEDWRRGRFCAVGSKPRGAAA